VQLQFQDRVGQILQHVVDSMLQAEDLPDLAQQSGTVQEHVQQHLDKMARTYTTEEQRRLHRGLESQVVAPQEITFF
jgi:methyl-accepting chemotaxis protein